MLLKNKNAVIYGAGGEIGGAVARAFAREGARVFLAGRTLATLDAVAQDIASSGGAAETAQVDAFDKEAIERHLEEVVQKAESVDISFNAVGIPYSQGDPFTEMPLEEFTAPLAAAMQTQFLTATAVARHMAKKGSGVILTITATPARLANPNSGSFGVACAAIEGFCRQLAGEVGSHGIRVVCLRSTGSPDGPKLSEFMRQLAELEGMSREAFVARIAQKTVLKRMASLAEVGNMAALVASDYASAMSGTVANITCGEVVD